jgi:HK97 family phage portal protein
MGILTGALQRATKVPGVAVGSENSWLRGLFNFNESATGIKVDEFNALNVTAIYACVRILAESIASLPLPTYERMDGAGKRRATEHYLFHLLHDAPNSEMSSFELLETMMGHVLLWGNAYAELVRDGAGRVREIWPLRPDRMVIWRDSATGEIIYIYTVKSSFDLTRQPEKVVLDSSQILHIRGLGYDGVRGYSPITLNREAVGLALATQEYGARLFSNGARPSGILSSNRPLNAEAKKNLREDWQQLYGTLQNANRTAVLEEGVTWQAIGLPPEDAQFLATRTYQLNEIARMFRIPPHLLQELTRSTNNNIEHQGLDYVTHTVRPWTVRWEQAFYRSLFLPSERDQFFAEFLLDGLLRGDQLSRYQAYAVGRQWGWLNADEIRDKENMNPIPGEGGDDYLTPLNMAPDAGSGPVAPGGAPADMGTAQDQGVDGGGTDTGGGGDGAAGRSILDLFASDVLTRIAKRERQDITRAAEKYLKKGQPAKFRDWLPTFAKDNREFIAQQVLGLQKAAGRDEADARQYAETRVTALLSIISEATTEDDVISRLDQWMALHSEQLALVIGEHRPVNGAAPIQERTPGELALLAGR